MVEGVEVVEVVVKPEVEAVGGGEECRGVMFQVGSDCSVVTSYCCASRCSQHMWIQGKYLWLHTVVT